MSGVPCHITLSKTQRSDRVIKIVSVDNRRVISTAQTTFGEKQKLKFVYYESMKRKLKTRPLYECQYDERLKTKSEESTCPVYTVDRGTGIPKESIVKIETRLIDEMFASVGEYVFLK